MYDGYDGSESNIVKKHNFKHRSLKPILSNSKVSEPLHNDNSSDIYSNIFPIPEHKDNKV